jgi:hypothetical protein
MGQSSCWWRRVTRLTMQTCDTLLAAPEKQTTVAGVESNLCGCLRGLRNWLPVLCCIIKMQVVE